MDKKRRMAIAGGGALGAAGLAAVVGLAVLNRDGEAPDAAIDGADVQICLKSDMTFFEGADARCYARSELLELRDRPVIDQDGQKVVVAMSDSDDAAAAPAQYSTCRDYDAARRADRYARTTREMRREAYFIRACGALELLLRARPAETSHFADGSPSAAEMTALSEDGLLRLGPDPAPVPADIEKTGPAEWRIDYADQRVMLQEIANADFDGDGVEEILAFLLAAPQNGTASVSAVALIEKDSADGPATLTRPVETPQERPSGAP